MSHMDGELDVDLSNGFTWSATLSVSHSAAPVVLYDLQQLRGGGSVTIELDESDKLRARVADPSGKVVSSTRSAVPDMGRAFLVSAHVEPKRAGRLTGVGVSLSLNGRQCEERRKSPFTLWSGACIHRIGASLDGDRAASFRLAEMMIFSRGYDPEAERQLWHYSRDRYALKQ